MFFQYFGLDGFAASESSNPNMYAIDGTDPDSFVREFAVKIDVCDMSQSPM